MQFRSSNNRECSKPGCRSRSKGSRLSRTHWQWKSDPLKRLHGDTRQRPQPALNTLLPTSLDYLTDEPTEKLSERLRKATTPPSDL